MRHRALRVDALGYRLSVEALICNMKGDTWFFIIKLHGKRVSSLFLELFAQ